MGFAVYIACPPLALVPEPVPPIPRNPTRKLREVVKNTVFGPHTFLLVSYDRKKLAQEGGEHILPVAADNAEKDAVLILDAGPTNTPIPG